MVDFDVIEKYFWVIKNSKCKVVGNLHGKFRFRAAISIMGFYHHIWLASKSWVFGYSWKNTIWSNEVWESNFRLYWKLPPGLEAEMFDSEAEMFYNADAGHEGLWRVGIARNALFFQSFVAPPVRKASSEKRGERICTTLWHQSDLKSKSSKTGSVSEHFFKLASAKFTPSCGTRAIWKSTL